MRESGLHQLYMVANSLQCVKASGDRGPGSGMSSGSRMNSAAGSGSGSGSLPHFFNFFPVFVSTLT